MHKNIPKICTGCRVSEAKIYLYHSTEIAKGRPHSEEWQTDNSVQKQWSMTKPSSNTLLRLVYFSVEQTLRGKHRWPPIAIMGVVDTFGP